MSVDKTFNYFKQLQARCYPIRSVHAEVAEAPEGGGHIQCRLWQRRGLVGLRSDLAAARLLVFMEHVRNLDALTELNLCL